MSKRQAQSGQGGSTGGHMADFNMDNTPEEKPQRATAAQLAARKIRPMRSRRQTPAGSSDASAPTFGGAFNPIDPNTVSSTMAGSQPPSTGFTFGQNQSFPGANSTPSQSTQNGSTPFSFGTGGAGGAGSSSFSFSSSFGGPQANNPFSSISTGSTGSTSQQPPQQPAAFSGFQGSIFNAPSAGNQSAAQQQQSLPSGSIFGAGSKQSNTGGIFGASANTGSSTQNGTAPTANIFGQGSTTSAPSNNIFGQTSASKPSIFGQSNPFGSDSMHISPDAKSVSSQKSSFPSTSIGSTPSSPAPSKDDSSKDSKPLFGGAFTGATSSSSESPAKFLFGAKPTEQTSTSPAPLFGGSASNQTTAASITSTTAPAPAATTTPFSSGLFGAAPSASPATPFKNPFQSSNLFSGVPSSTQKPSEEKKDEKTDEPKPADTPKNLFQFNSSTNATPSLFSVPASTSSPAPASSSTETSQPPSTGSLFAPKTTASSGQDKPQSAVPNPFGNLFAASKPATPSKPESEQKPAPVANPFGNLFSPKPAETPKSSESEKPVNPPALFSSPAAATPSPSTPSLFTPKSAAATPTAAPQSLFKVNGDQQTTSSSQLNKSSDFEELESPKVAGDVGNGVKADVETLHRLRTLNECFKREVAKADPSSGSFDAILQFYMRVRDTIGLPVATKRKAAEDVNGVVSKKVKTGTPIDVDTPATANSTPVAKTFRAAQDASPSSKKRKSIDEGEANGTPNGTPKRVNGDSTTANIFAQSFSKSKTSESDDDLTNKQSLSKPSTPAPKPSLFSATPATEPVKPQLSFSSSSTQGSTSTSLFSSSMSSAPPTSSASSEIAPKNPFVLKPSASQENGAISSSILAPPKFGTPASGNFFDQFKAQSEKDAAKEKAKRKAEDFDSEEEDEAEWERKDAEKQRKKQEEHAAQAKKRAKFVPGKGFVFEDAPEEPEKTEGADSAKSGASVFDKQNKSAAQPSNIFGHLSATPSEAEDNGDDEDNDTEEASNAGDDQEDAAKTVASDIASSAAESPAPSSEDGDFAKALQKSKPTKTADATSGGRSLFDRVSYDDEGKPKRQADEEQKNSVSTLFGASKFSSSLNTPTSFTQNSSSESEKSASKPATTNLFGSANTGSSIFSSAGSSPGAATPSIFSKPSGDNTWKPDSPIKFAASPSASGSATPAASETPKPFSSLFGAPSSLAKSGSASTQPSAGFSFGNPSLQAPSVLNSSALASATPSRQSTPGVTSDTGAEESGDGDGAENLPQADLRTGAGEEDEDVILENRARAMKHNKSAWESQGVGFVRILKHRTTSRGRILIRADPSGNVVLNTYLVKAISYKAAGNSVQFMVPQAEGPPEMWALRVKTKDDAERLSKTMEENKA
ncbi:RanBP1 domain protein [Aspergillus homomorphus CBS 101889]|uniref:RanBD1 domain-containing protein n=1 Tax=Aspergillus homomorphus (strain CBS 101889) TaxID=1450537 RepID=A0A395HHL8_ASPHC|nr:hypothetical protein BO97DRAFT_253289 [Aspergillus homomorphus CBS 101889]RAL07412.1 hypothetical protein BO97DRAFT_253289 [Aspergillus homomorphus CBS 101889]